MLLTADPQYSPLTCFWPLKTLAVSTASAGFAAAFTADSAQELSTPWQSTADEGLSIAYDRSSPLQQAYKRLGSSAQHNRPSVTKQ